MQELKPGRTLPNGALVLHHDPEAEIVLAFSVISSSDGQGEYVVWSLGADGSTSWADYFVNFDNAVTCYQARRRGQRTDAPISADVDTAERIIGALTADQRQDLLERLEGHQSTSDQANRCGRKPVFGLPRCIRQRGHTGPCGPFEATT